MRDYEVFAPYVSEKLGCSFAVVLKTARLFDSGMTIPFIARYRKEVTEGMDEVKLAELQKWLERMAKMEDRKKTMLDSLRESGHFSAELENAIRLCLDEHELEDIYLPFKPKRKTRASAAREKGLDSLAQGLLKGHFRDPEEEAARHALKAGISAEDALAGAMDILAEQVAEHAEARKFLRKLFFREGMLVAKKARKAGTEAEKFRDYFTYSESVFRMPAHRILAVFRGENEGALSLSVEVDEDRALDILRRNFRVPQNRCGLYVEKALIDSLKRLLWSSMENEVKAELKEKADRDSIRIFGENLVQLLMAPPLGSMRILAIDPGFRTGCKVVCLDETGNLLHNETVYPHPPQNEKDKAAKTVRRLVESYKIQAIAIGNGTAGRETEDFIRFHIRFPADSEVKLFSVSEAGASVYSASAIAREEFPGFDVTVRGAVSIGRRLMDPLAELVKIDPKAVGVGMYQHDVDQNLLKEELDRVVESCVNKVGVELNTAGFPILTHISGLGPALAKNIVDFRTKNGPFASRSDLLKVPKLGPKAFEQCAGFLRIRDGKNPLDNSAVHPERYALVEKMASDMGLKPENLIRNPENAERISLKAYVSPEVGLPTLEDIKAELLKPGRDPRKSFKMMEFDAQVRKPEDLLPGMILPGIVTNITHFGCFVDVGVKQDGLVHVSQLADRFVSDPAQVVRLHQQVKVKVLECDLLRKRISFTMKGLNP
jgi:uncharacterized protein